MRALPAFALAALLAACQRPAPQPPPPAPPAALTPTAASIPKEQNLPPTVAGLLREAVVVEPGDRTAPLLTDGQLIVDPATTFRVIFERRLPDARLVLLDPEDAFVPSEGSREDADASTTLTLKPTRPLTGGSIYTVRVDGAAAREVRDEKGNVFQPFSRQITIAGAPEPAPAPEKPAKPARKKKDR